MAGNPTSHFNRCSIPADHFVLLRFSFLSLATALVDNLAFVLAFFTLSNILRSNHRPPCTLFNYPLPAGRFPRGKLRYPAEVSLLVTASGAVS
jgi:hypothetical protein